MQQSDSMLFTKLPLEIRRLIYEQVLVSASVLAGVANMVGKEKTKRRMLNSYIPITDIDSAVLRACRKVYTEALPVLYGGNTFKFSNTAAMNDFKEKGLIRRGPLPDQPTIETEG